MHRHQSYRLYIHTGSFIQLHQMKTEADKKLICVETKKTHTNTQTHTHTNNNAITGHVGLTTVACGFAGCSSSPIIVEGADRCIVTPVIVYINTQYRLFHTTALNRHRDRHQLGIHEHTHIHTHTHTNTNVNTGRVGLTVIVYGAAGCTNHPIISEGSGECMVNPIIVYTHTQVTSYHCMK
jgi:hypothetical protein